MKTYEELLRDANRLAEKRDVKLAMTRRSVIPNRRYTNELNSILYQLRSYIKDTVKINLSAGNKEWFVNPIVPRWSGVYILKNKNKQRYIGSSENIRKRLMNHRISRLYGPIINIVLYKTNTYTEALYVEGKMVAKLRPELNRAYVKDQMAL